MALSLLTSQKKFLILYDGQEVITVDLRCDNSLMKTMIDRFGEDVKALVYDMTSKEIKRHFSRGIS